MRNKKTIIILSILIVAIISSLAYVSYGYVTSKIEGNSSSKKYASLTQVLKVEYSGGTNELTTEQSGYFVPGSTLTKTFTIKNIGNVNLNFSINLSDLTNDFVRKDDLVYEIYLDEELIISDTLPSSSTDVTIAYNQTLDKNQTKTYTLNIKYLESEENQIIDQGKTITGNISFEKQNKGLSGIKILGNTIQNGTPSPTTPVEMESVGEKNLEIENAREENNNLLDNKKLVVSDNANEKWEITETGIKQTKISSAGYVLKTLFDITDLVEPNTAYYFHNEIEKNFNCGDGACSSLAGHLGIYIDGQSVGSIYVDESDRLTIMPSEFEKVEIKTYTVPYDNIINEHDETMSYYFEWKNLYMSTEPYKDYDPYGYEIPIVVSGKNLANFSIVSNQWQTNTEELSPNSFKVTKANDSAVAYGQIETYLEPGKTYTLYTIIDSEKTGGYVHAWKDYNAGSVYNSKIAQYYTFTATQEKFVLGLYPAQESGLSGLETIFTFMLVEGEYDSKNYPEYEPYYEPLTYNIYLDAPLRKVGNCTDYTCMDYIDFNTRKIVRNIRFLEFDGSESWRYYNYNDKYIGFKTNGWLDGNHTRTIGISNFTSRVGGFYSGNDYMWLGIDGNAVHYLGTGHYDSNLEDKGLANFKSYLNSNHLKIQYLAKHIETEDIDIPYLAEIPADKTISVVTTVPAEVVIE